MSRPVALLALLAVALVAALLTWLAPGGWPWAVAFSLAAGAAVLTAPAPADFSARRTVAAILFVPVAIGVLLPAGIGLLAAAGGLLNALAQGEQGRAMGEMLVASLVACVLLAAAHRWPRRLPDWLFLAALTVLVLALRLAYVLLVVKQPASDFAGMWRLCNEVSQHGLAMATGAEDHLTRVHLERVLPYLLPLNLLFGGGRLVYALPNAALTLACSWLTYLLARGWLSRPAARIAFAVSAIAPETIFVIGIPGHDLPGAFFTLAAIAAFGGVRRLAVAGRLPRASAAAVGFGLLLLVTDVQRTNALFLFVAFGLVVAGQAAVDLASRARGAGTAALRQAALAWLVPLVVFLAGDASLSAARLRMSDEMGALWRGRAIAGHTDSWSPGTQGDAVSRYYKRYRDLTAEEWSQLARRKLLSDLHHNPAERTSYVLRKSRLLWHLGRQRDFYLRDAFLVPLDRHLSRPELTRLGLHNALFASVFLALMLCGTIGTWRRHELPLAALLPALYMALLGGFLVLLFQPQSRYLFHVWYLGSLYVGAALGGRRSEAPPAAAV